MSTFPDRASTYPAPYALIRYGGVTYGQRPRTVLAWVHEERNNGRSLRVRIIDLHPVTREMTPRYKHDKTIPALWVVASWKYPPSARAVREARRALPVSEVSEGEDIS